MGDRTRHAYAACYCEENVWHLAGDTTLPASERHVVFISNPDRTCAIWAQRSASDASSPVIWDYHVILVTRSPEGAQVWDLDSTLPFPARLEAYLAGSFPRAGRIPERYAPRFRVVSAELFRATFASDRTHMIDEEGGYRTAPPPWPPIDTARDAMNLQQFIDTEASFVGETFDLDGLRARFGA